MGHEIVAECKNVAVLTKSIIDEVCEKYRYPFFPKHLHLVISPRTEVSQEVRNYARKRGIQIIRLRY